MSPYPEACASRIGPMPQNSTLRRRQKARRTKKLELWRQNQAAQQAQSSGGAKKAAKKTDKKG